MTRTKPLRDLRTCNPQQRIDALVAQGIEQLAAQQQNPMVNTVLDMFRPVIHQQLRRNLGPRALPDLHKALRSSQKGGADNHQSNRSTTGQSEHTGNRGAAHGSGGMTRTDALKVLGLPPSATNADIKAAYRECCVQYHPDKVMNLSPAFQRLADEQMKKVNAAYQFLKGAK